VALLHESNLAKPDVGNDSAEGLKMTVSLIVFCFHHQWDPPR